MGNMISKKKRKRSNNIKPNARQRQAVKNVVEGMGITKALKASGYSDSVSEKNQLQVTESKGFLQALSESGVSIDNLNALLHKDLHDDSKRSVQHLQLGYKLHGKLRETQEGNKTLIVNISGQSQTRFREHIDKN